MNYGEIIHLPMSPREILSGTPDGRIRLSYLFSPKISSRIFFSVWRKEADSLWEGKRDKSTRKQGSIHSESSTACGEMINLCRRRSESVCIDEDTHSESGIELEKIKNRIIHVG